MDITHEHHLTAKRRHNIMLAPQALFNTKVYSPRQRLNTPLKTDPRNDLESFITNKFQQKHSAVVREFMPTLVELERDDKTVAGIGLRVSEDQPFFLEQYLNQSITLTLNQLSGLSVEKRHIVEIGNFAASNARVGSLLFIIIAHSLFLAGYQWMVFTAIRDVERMIAHLGCDQHIIKPAEQSKLSNSANDWGDYYDKKPNVIACNLKKTITKSKNNKIINQYITKHHLQILSLSSQLKIGRNKVL